MKDNRHITAHTIKSFYHKVKNLLFNFIEKEKINIYITGESCKALFFELYTKAPEFEFCVVDPRGVAPIFDYIVDVVNTSGFLELHDVVDKGTTIEFILSEKNKGLYNVDIPVILYMCQDENGNFTEDLKVDALRKDFYCNTLYILAKYSSYDNLSDCIIEDPLSIRESDVDSGIIRIIGNIDEKIRKDPSLILRTVRQCILHKNELDINTRIGLHWIPEFDEIPFEELVDDFLEILLHDTSGSGIRLLHEVGILKRFMPEFEEAWGFNVNEKSQVLSLTDHLISSLSLLRRSSNFNYFGEHYDALIFATLLHDIAKYKCYTVNNETGYIIYPDNEIESAKVAEVIMTRLGIDEKTIRYACKLINHQYDLRTFWDYDTKTYTGDEAMTELLYNKFNDEKIYPDILALINADNTARHPDWSMVTQIDQFKDKVNNNIIPSEDPLLKKEKLIEYLGTDNETILTGVKRAIKKIECFQIGYPKVEGSNILEIYDSIFSGKEIRLSNYVKRLSLGPIRAELVKDSQTDIPFSKCESYLISEPDIKRIILDPSIDIGKHFVEVENKKGIRTRELHIDAKYYPEVYLGLRSYNAANEIFDKVSDLLSQLGNIPGKLSYFISGDRECTIGQLKIDNQIISIL